MNVNYDKVTVGIVCENKNDIGIYFRMFVVLLEDKIVKLINNPHMQYIETERFKIDFKTKNYSQRGWRRHYILNLTQDEEFHETCVAPKTIIRDYLVEDEKWDGLFSKDEINNNWSLKTRREYRDN